VYLKLFDFIELILLNEMIPKIKAVRPSGNEKTKNIPANNIKNELKPKINVHLDSVLILGICFLTFLQLIGVSCCLFVFKSMYFLVFKFNNFPVLLKSFLSLGSKKIDQLFF
jgi:hypothetical protein